MSIRRLSIAFVAKSLFGCLLVVLASCANEPIETMTAIEDFCSDPRIVEEMQHQDPKLEPMGQPSCTASKIAFRHNGVVTDIAITQVLRGYAHSGDVGWGVSDSIIRLPEDRLVNLGPNAPVPVARTSALLSHLMASLDIDASEPSAYQIHHFYSAFLELTKRGYCVTYKMQPPFEGQLSQCSSLERFVGDVSYMPSATDWQEANAIACALVHDGSARCAVLSMSLVAGAHGQALYLVEFRIAAPASSGAQYQHLYYPIDAMSGTASSRGQRMSDDPEIPIDTLLQGT